MGLRSSDQAKLIQRIRPNPDLQVCTALTIRRPHADQIPYEGHIMGEGSDQQFGRSSA